MTFTDIISITASFFFISLIFFLAFYWLVRKQGINREAGVLVDWLKSMQGNMQNSNSHLHNTLLQNNKNITDTLQQSSHLLNKRLDMATTIIAEVAKELGKMHELNRSVQDLQMILKSPKLRGNLGEEILADMLAQVLPRSHFELQYTFKSGDKVDAIIKTHNGYLSIDAKFPMENFIKKNQATTESASESFTKLFLQDVKKHIKIISNKYILPQDGTLDFALMYVPSEVIYYDMIRTTDLLTFSREQRVYPVSPNTMYAHLQTILLSLEGQKLEEKSRQVMKLLRMLQKDYTRMEDNFLTLGKHLNYATNQYSNVASLFQLLGQKINQPLLDE